jgi:sulfotransferase
MIKGFQNLHVISGLPRSGSTLLSSLLSQNPNIYASISSPLLGSIVSVRDHFNAADFSASSLVKESEQLELYRHMIEGYYKARRSNRKIIFDTNRAWTGNLGLLHVLYPNSKVIVCVRSVAAIVDSFERIFRASPFVMPKLFGGPHEWGTVYSRVDALTQRGRVVGGPWISLKEGLYSEHSDKLLLVEYDLLAQSPLKVLEQIYHFLDIEPFEGHFTEGLGLLNSEQEKVQQFDENLGAPMLHQLKPSVRYEVRDSVLPPDLLQTMEELNFWNSLEGTNAKILKCAP